MNAATYHYFGHHHGQHQEDPVAPEPEWERKLSVKAPPAQLQHLPPGLDEVCGCCYEVSAAAASAVLKEHRTQESDYSVANQHRRCCQKEEGIKSWDDWTGHVWSIHYSKCATEETHEVARLMRQVSWHWHPQWEHSQVPAGKLRETLQLIR